MVVGCGRIILRIHDCRSLKAKRRVVKAVIARIRNHFNAAVAEIEDNDLYQRAVIGVALLDSEMEIIHL